MPKEKVHITWLTNKEGVEVIVFCKGTEVLTEVPKTVIGKAAEFAFDFMGETSGASLTFTVANAYTLHVAAWWGSRILVTLWKQGDPCPQGTWFLAQVDPWAYA